MSTRKLDAAWKHGREKIDENNRKKVKCNYCSKEVGGITRLKYHLAKVGTDVKGCLEVPSQVSQEIYNSLYGQIKNVTDRGQPSGQPTNAGIEEGAHQDLVLPQQVSEEILLNSLNGQKKSVIDRGQPSGQPTNAAIEEGGHQALVLPQQVSEEILLNSLNGQKKNVTDIGQPSGQPRNSEIEEGGHQALVLPQLRITFKGIVGACSEEAVLAVYPHCKKISCQTFEEALKDVENLHADKAIIPIENSLGGSFYENYDLIYSHELHIVGEFEVPMNFCLLAQRGVQLKDLRRVLGHPQALRQTKSFWTNLDLEKDIVDDEPYYARLIDTEQLSGVIGSAKAVESYHLSVVARGIQDENEKKSITRFWILARDPIVPTNDKPFKTSLVFTLKEGPKELCKALSVFAASEITLTKVESRPQRDILPNEASSSSKGTAECFDYIFYVDFEASMLESRVECALRYLKEFATYVRVLGSYPLIEVSRNQ